MISNICIYIHIYTRADLKGVYHDSRHWGVQSQPQARLQVLHLSPWHWKQIMEDLNTKNEVAELNFSAKKSMSSYSISSSAK